jgi:hypothetical protein
VNERLLENWLDSVNERDYQLPFCQVLCAKGHRIIHSTRHSSIEFGKDIVSIAPDGVPCAYQLKGNPGGRLTLLQYREIESQLFQLVNHPINHPSVPRQKNHRSYLVTNGLIEEETVQAINQMNDGLARDGFPHRRIHVIQRGDLLKDCGDLGLTLWPSELTEMTLLLELVVNDGKGLLPKEKVHALLADLLRLKEENEGKLKKENVRRRITSAALLIPVALKNYSLRENHFASICAWTMFCAYIISACERHGVSFKREAHSPLVLGMTAIKDSLLSLSYEVAQRSHMLEGGDLADPVVYRARYTLLLALQSLLWFWCEETGWPNSSHQGAVEKFLSEGKQFLYIWGEAAIPQFLLYYWFLSKSEGSSVSELWLGMVIRAITSEDSDGLPKGLPSPYYDFETVARHMLSNILNYREDVLREESWSGRSFYAESLFHLLVRTGRKQTCKLLWPSLTKVAWASFQPEKPWQYCLFRTNSGVNKDVQTPFEKQWDDLVKEARSIECPIVPRPLAENRYLLALFVLLFPYRGTPEVIRYLGWKYDDNWFIATPDVTI